MQGGVGLAGESAECFCSPQSGGSAPSPGVGGGADLSWPSLAAHPSPQGGLRPSPVAEGASLPPQEARGRVPARRRRPCVRGLPEPGADLISRGQLCAVHIWRRAEPPPLPPAWRYLPGMLAAQHASGARFWGQPAPPPAPGPGAGGGPRPARISWLLPLPWWFPVVPGDLRGHLPDPCPPLQR